MSKYNIPYDYKINHDPEKDYNNIDETYLPPYRSESYPSIYKGVTVEMHIVDHCNMNCNCCNHFSPLAEPWFISIEDFTLQIKELKENVSSVKSFILLGGEPTLHPHLLDLCKILRNEFPNIYIHILSNGLSVDNIIKDKLEYEKLHIFFGFTNYPHYTKVKQIQDNLSSIGAVSMSRVISKQTLVNINGHLNKHNNFFNCSNHKLPCLTLKNHKLYICPFCAHIEHFCKKANMSIPEEKGTDYLLVTDIKNNLDILQDFCFTPKNYCKYCVQYTPAFAFGLSNRDTLEYTESFEDLYFKYYDRYLEVINLGQSGNLQWCLDKKNNPGRIDYIFQPHDLQRELLRWGGGKVDIIIPYYNETIDQLIALKDNLLTQTIIKDCVIYLISDNSNMDRRVIQIFTDYPELHCVFLKNKKHEGPGAARNIGIENSRNDIILFLDADDLFAKSNSLEELYNQVQNVKLLEFRSYLNKDVCKTNHLIKRELLKELNFKPFYFGEDKEFHYQLIATTPKEDMVELNNKENDYIIYNATQGINITSTFFYYDNLHFSLLSSNYLGIYNSLIKGVKNYNRFFSDITNFLSIFRDLLKYNPKLSNDSFIKVFTYYMLYNITLKMPELKNDKFVNDIQDILDINISDNTNYSQIIAFLIKYIEEKYLPDDKLHYNAIYMLQLLNNEVSND